MIRMTLALALGLLCTPSFANNHDSDLRDHLPAKMTVNFFGHPTAAIATEGVIATRSQEAFCHFIGAPNVTLRVFNNGGEFPDTGGDNINNDSLVFQNIYEPANGVCVTALFTGDIEDAQGELLVDQLPYLVWAVDSIGDLQNVPVTP